MSGFNCTDFSPGCTIDESFYAYRPSLPANGFYIAIFVFAFCVHFAQGIWWRRAWKGFAAAMVLGCIAEVIGYGGRIISHRNPFDQNGFLIQICCITVAPAFLSAGVYFCLGTIVEICDPSISRIPPRFYAYIFIPCDIVSLILQAIGGAMASIATTNMSSPDRGDNIMIAGVSFQVLTLSIFMFLSCDYFLRVRRSKWCTEQGKEEMRLDSEKFLHKMVKLSEKLGLVRWRWFRVDVGVAEERGVDRRTWGRTETRLFKVFLWALGVATVAILVRCVYRVVEMSDGWYGAVIANENLFIGFEGVCISVAVLLLIIFHPGHCLRTPLASMSEKSTTLSAHMKRTHRISAISDLGDLGTSNYNSLSSFYSKQRFSLKTKRDSTFNSTHSAAPMLNPSDTYYPNTSCIQLPPLHFDPFPTRPHSSRDSHADSHADSHPYQEVHTDGDLGLGYSISAEREIDDDEGDLESLDEEATMKRPLSLADALKESRLDTMASTASVEGWAGQNLRDSIRSGSLNRDTDRTWSYDKTRNHDRTWSGRDAERDRDRTWSGRNYDRTWSARDDRDRMGSGGKGYWGVRAEERENMLDLMPPITRSTTFYTAAASPIR